MSPQTILAIRTGSSVDRFNAPTLTFERVEGSAEAGQRQGNALRPLIEAQQLPVVCGNRIVGRQPEGGLGGGGQRDGQAIGKTKLQRILTPVEDAI